MRIPTAQELERQAKELSPPPNPNDVEKTPDDVALIFKNARCSVDIINNRPAPTDTVGKERWISKIRASVNHLETIKNYKKVDKTTSIWTNEDFTAIDAAITKGKSLIA